MRNEEEKTRGLTTEERKNEGGRNEELPVVGPPFLFFFSLPRPLLSFLRSFVVTHHVFLEIYVPRAAQQRRTGKPAARGTLRGNQLGLWEEVPWLPLV